MGLTIESGGVESHSALVDATGRLLSRAIGISQIYEEGVAGRAYYVTTEGFVNVTTTASYSGLLYIKNTSPTNHMHIHEMRESAEASTRFKLIKNPTTGTLITGGTVITPPNLNFSDRQTLQAEVRKGVSGSTVTDGTHLTQWSATNAFLIKYDGAIVLMPGDSIALMAQPSVATNIGVSILVFSHYHPLSLYTAAYR